MVSWFLPWRPARNCGSFSRHICLLLLLHFALPAVHADTPARKGEVLIMRSPAVASAAATGRLRVLGLSMIKTQSPRLERILLNDRQAERAVSTAEAESEVLSDAELAELEATCAQLKASGIATHCSPNYRYQIAAVTPNDPKFGNQYHTALMQVPEAWDITTGSAAVTVAVIDTGIMLAHPDLAANIWTNPGEVADGLDNDSNGLIDDLHGYDWVNHDSTPADDQGHGTLVSGIIAAVGNNGIGVVGINHTARIQVLKAFSNAGTGFGSDILLAIDYAVNHGASVINMSFAGFPYSEVFKAAIENAGNHGVLVVCGAGNDSRDNDTMKMYPASFDTPNNIAVAASDSADRLTDFSNFGATEVDLAAPGIGIWTTGITGGYGTALGTSMAAPQVAGAAALVKAANSALGPTDIKAVLLETVDPLANLSGVVLTGGRLNVFRAVTVALGRTPASPPTDPDPRDGTPALGSLQLDAERLGAKRFELSVLASESARGVQGSAVAAAPVTIRCRETGARRKRYLRSGLTNTDGIFSTRITISADKAQCTAQAENETVSNRVTLRKR